MNVSVIGISGPIKSGKSEAAQFIKKKLENVHVLSFAYPLKNVIQELFYLESEQLHDHTLKEIKDPNLGVAPRKLMQFFGTEIFRNKNLLRSLYSSTQLQEHEYPIFLQQNSESFWIWHLQQKIQSIIEKNVNSIIVIEDVRYEDEYQFLKNTFNAKFIYIKNQDQMLTQNHSSEQNHLFLQNNADFFIQNNSTLDLYHQQLATILQKFTEHNRQ